MKLSIKAGTTSKIITITNVWNSDGSGAKVSNLVYNSSGLTAYFNRVGAAGAAVQISLVSATKGTWVSGGFVAVDSTNMPGDYELHLPDAALAAGAKEVIVTLKGVTGMVGKTISIELTATDNQSDDFSATQKTSLNASTPASVQNISAQTGDSFARLGAPVAASISADIANVSTAVVSGSSANLVAQSQTVTTGTVISGGYADTASPEGTAFVLAPVTPAVNGYGLNVALVFDASDSQTIDTVHLYARFASGAGRTATVWLYNYATSAWVQWTSVTLSNSANYVDYSLTNITPAYQSGTGEISVAIRSTSTNTGDRLSIDQMLVSVVTAGPTTAEIADAVYDKMKLTTYVGEVWIDTNAGTAGTVLGVNGIVSNPCLTYADAYAVATALGVKHFHFIPDAEITLTNNHDYWEFTGRGKINLNGQSIHDAKFDDCESITGTSAGDDAVFSRCKIGMVTLGSFEAYTCGFSGTHTLVASGKYDIIDCFDDDPGTTSPSFVFAANAEVSLRGWHGGVNVRSLASTNLLYVNGEGRVVLESSCNQGIVSLRGNLAITDQVVGGFVAGGGTLTETENFRVGNSFTDMAKDSTVAKSAELAKVPKSDSNVTFNSTALASINEEVVDALNVDTYAEPGQGAPPATASIVAKLNYWYKSWRNKTETTATELRIYNDAGNVIDQKSSISDDGSTTTKGEFGTGA